MLPPFDLQGGLVLAAVRAASVAGLLSVFGALVFRVAVLPRVFAKLAEPVSRLVERQLFAATSCWAAAALACMIGWLIVQAASIAGATSVGSVVAALPKVAVETRFGHLALLQLTALASVWVALGRRDRPGRQPIALGFSCLALGLQAGHSHGAAMSGGPSLLLGFELLHLAGAGAWLGGLLPLLLVVRAAPPHAAATAARWFSPLGKLCIAALVVSAIGQSWVLVGSLAGFVGTAYGWIILLKLTIFAVLLAFAAANRYRLAPALLTPNAIAARRTLLRSIAVQTGFGLAVVFAAAVLSNLPPAMHLQPLWPFAERFSAAALHEDPAFRIEALAACLAIALAIILIVAARVFRRRGWLGLVAAAPLLWFAAPHLGPLLVPAYPTSFYRSPTGFSAVSIAAGAALYPPHCAACHGAGGRGDGAAAPSLPVPPADLAAQHLWMHSDGELFWWLSHGMTAPNGEQAMPGFGNALSEDQRWALIDYIRARNAGLAFAATGVFPAPVQAPDLQAQCPGGRVLTLASLRGQFVRLIVASAHNADSGVTTILLSPIQSAAARCVAADDSLSIAYAIISGIAIDQLPGAQFLVDEDGWLRAVQRGDTPFSASWNNPQALAKTIARLQAEPVSASMPGAVPMDMKM